MIGALVVAVMGAAPAAGSYIAEGGTGTLTLSAGKFTIQTVGGNAHICELEGTWKGETAATGDEGLGVCHLKILASGKDVQVTSIDDEPCRAWCGARASFDGLFISPVKGCRAGEIKTARDSFKKAYGKKKWAEAIAALKPVLDSCVSVIDRFELLWIRNDLALTQHHAGDDAACLATLEPTSELWSLSDEDAGGGEPAYEDVMKRLVRATKTNAKLCGGIK